MNDDRDPNADVAEVRASRELEKLRATASSLSELSTGLNEMVETLSRIIARRDVPLED